jgi:hypothetical protein
VTTTIGWIDPDNRTLSRTVVAAFRPDGAADRRFGRDGVSVQPLGTRVALQRNDRMVLVWEQSGADSGGHSRLVVRRLDVRGRPDAAFPRTRLDTVANMYIGLDVAIDRRGRIVIAGGAFTTYGSSGLILVRLKGATG